jgi:hypothetical protein
MNDSTKVSFLSCWLKSTGIIYLLYALLGLGSAGAQGMAYQMGAGLIRAPLLGLIVGGVWWMVKR